MRRRLSNCFGVLAITGLGVALGVAVAGPVGALDNLRFPLLFTAICYALASWAARRPWQERRVEAALVHPAFPWAVFVVAGLVFTRIKFLQWNAGQITGEDFSHLDYAIWSTAHGRFMEIPILPPQKTFTDFFGNHYSPVLLIHSAARWVVDSPFTSLTVHAWSLAAAVIPLHALAKQLVDRISSSLLVLTFLFCGAVASTLQFEIHQESFYPLAFGIVFLGLYTKVSLLWIGALLALATKEDAGVYLFPIFLFLAWRFPARRFHCFLLAFFCLLYTGLVLKVLMPMHQPPATGAPYYLPMWGKYGTDFSSVAWGMLTQPHLVFWDIFGNKALYKNLLPWGFFPLLTPYGFLALPSAAVSSTAGGPQGGFGLYYGIVLVPCFFFASAQFLAGVRRRRTAALICLGLSTFVGGSYLRFPAPLPFLAELEASSVQLSSAATADDIIVQNGLLPFLPYRTQWKRLGAIVDVPPPGKASVALFDGLHLGSLGMDTARAGEELEKRGYRKFAESGRFRWYR